MIMRSRRESICCQKFEHYMAEYLSQSATCITPNSGFLYVWILLSFFLPVRLSLPDSLSLLLKVPRMVLLSSLLW